MLVNSGPLTHVHMKTSVAPTPKLPYSGPPLGGNPQPLALNDSPVTLCTNILMLIMFKTLTASFTFFKAELNLGYVYCTYPIRQSCCK